MCNPGLAMLGAQAAGGGASLIGSIFGAKSAKSSYQFQARMADINARIADGNARNIIAAGIVEESRIKMAGSQAKGSQIARMASSGIDLAGSPTAQARLAGTDLITEVDANTLRGNALRAAWGQRFEAGDQRSKALMARASASSISPAMAGFTSLLGTATQVASSWYALNREGGLASKSANGTALNTDMWPEAQSFASNTSSAFGKDLNTSFDETFGKGPSMMSYGRGY